MLSGILKDGVGTYTTSSCTYADAKNDPSITIISICLQNIQNI